MAATDRTKVRSSFANIKTVEQAMLTKLADSLLTQKDARKLALKPYTADAVLKLNAMPVARAGFQIPYFDLKGRPTKFFRFRFLEYGEAGGGFQQLIAGTAKPLRYAQQADTVNELYLPPLIDWAAYANDSTRPLIITEGELKSACATKHGYACIGLGGVWCFKSSQHNLPLLPQFQLFQWTGRPVFICFDSDAATNPLVVQAENALAHELLNLGAVTFIARVPQAKDGKKCGIDDYILAHGPNNFNAKVLQAAEQWDVSKELFKLNEEVLYVRDPGLVLELKTMQRLTARAFVDHAYAPRILYQSIPGPNGSTRVLEKSAAKEWIKWPCRMTVGRITYLPGAERVTPEGEFNCWRGWGVEPKLGDVTPWERLLDYLFKNTVVDARHWFQQWLACPLQQPGIKLYSASVLWGIHHGTGKSMVGYTMGEIYGENFTEIGDRDLYANFNDWAERRQFVMGEEITGGDKRATADRMKGMITQRQLRVNTKFVPTYIVPDCINYYFTSNHPDAFFLEDSDRRFFVHEVTGKPLDDSFYREYMTWLRNGGAAALFHHFLTLDLKNFNPQGHAFVTNSKKEMIEDGRSELGAWVSTLKEDADRLLAVGDVKLPYKLWTTDELLRLFDPEKRGRVTANGLGRELRRAGFVRACEGTTIKTQVAGYQRLWIIRPSGLKATKPAEYAALFDKERAGFTKSKKF